MRHRFAESTALETTMQSKMAAVPQNRVTVVMKNIAAAIESRRAVETTGDAPLSKDFRHIEDLHKDTVARFFVAVGVNPEYYINSPSYDPETFAAKSKLPVEVKTRNLKAAKKYREAADYFATGGKLESVLKTFVACSILSSAHTSIIPRDVCERFLSSVPLNHVSEELQEALDHYRANHMTQGAGTQTSQCTLTLANMKAATCIRDGRSKNFMLDVDSPVVESFAQRFNMVPQLERARDFRKRVTQEALANVTAEAS